MKYIDADKLIAEINARIERCEKDEEDGYPDTTSPKANKNRPPLLRTWT